MDKIHPYLGLYLYPIKGTLHLSSDKPHPHLGLTIPHRGQIQLMELLHSLVHKTIMVQVTLVHLDPYHFTFLGLLGLKMSAQAHRASQRQHQIHFLSPTQLDNHHRLLVYHQTLHHRLLIPNQAACHWVILTNFSSSILPYPHWNPRGANQKLHPSCQTSKG